MHKSEPLEWSLETKTACLGNRTDSKLVIPHKTVGSQNCVALVNPMFFSHVLSPYKIIYPVLIPTTSIL